MLVCQTLPSSHLDRPDSVDLGSFVQELHICNLFAPSALASLSVVTSSLGLGSHSFEDQVTQGRCSLFWVGFKRFNP